MAKSARPTKRRTKANQAKPREYDQTGHKERPQSPTVLVVDDDDDIRSLVSQMLRKEGYCVLEASSGAEAELAAISKTPQLILMDIGMPGLDGLSVVWRLRQHPEIANVPVVIVTAYDSFDLRAEAAAAGCRGYLTKPMEPRELISLVSEVLHN